MINLLDLSFTELKQFFADMGEKPFRATQVMQWIYHEGVLDFDAMTNLSKACRESLKTNATLTLPDIVTRQHSQDGTRKWLLNVAGGNAIEVVFIPENERGTLCISSQAGCALACPFCSTAHEGFNRNLSAAEIIGQVWIAMQELGWQKSGRRKITNVVFMGMGEPLLNYQAVVKAANLMMDDRGFGLSKRRVTISTSGIVPKIHALKTDSSVALAVSLHAPTDELRDVIVPINKKYPIATLMDACKAFVQDEHRKKHITWEYVMLDGVNDSLAHARDLYQLVKDLPGKINLIPFNPFPGSTFSTSTPETIAAFQQCLVSKGALVTVRKTRGDDIAAACGQLVGEVKDKSRRERILVRQR
ncbi:23S rRNA (adenine(2503)-C(2))-methyltransferase RlmN [Ostreibacterium oceani]|uniref:Dual-specificity RNA methyltransferase RlmN n=1 Tax=Ostreibacterium oceani TaxID=2654998 RepID=A0A6N7EW92_9GAMM|nr:23S rRNA (adenine(2503)-C(2))-methyltransferase RlmN [Ostreibacterium oceani]MPV85855.1 23S rRNA (adenine(2503)-C(2))-methyltransferase RlmN [Ostreibacterium oceani]